MISGLKLLGLFVRDLLVQPEGSVVQVGRNNFRRDDFTALQVVVDTLGASNLLASSEKFDGELESMAYTQSWSMPCIINFYGDGAAAEAIKFSNIIQSQAGYELQRDLGLTVYDVGTITDVKLLTGEQYSERIELALNIRFTTTTNIDTLRIDEAVIDDLLVD